MNRKFTALVEGIRQVEAALGDGVQRSISQGEMINRENLAKSLVAAESLRQGTIIEPRHLKVRSPGQGLSAQNYKTLGRVVKRDMEEEEFFYGSDLLDVKSIREIIRLAGRGESQFDTTIFLNITRKLTPIFSNFTCHTPIWI